MVSQETLLSNVSWLWWATSGNGGGIRGSTRKDEMAHPTPEPRSYVYSTGAAKPPTRRSDRRRLGRPWSGMRQLQTISEQPSFSYSGLEAPPTLGWVSIDFAGFYDTEVPQQPTFDFFTRVVANLRPPHVVDALAASYLIRR